MKKIIVCILGALTGAMLAAAVHCSFMVTKMYDSSMFPAIEPGQKVVVFMAAKVENIGSGDIVAYESPYHLIDGGRGISIRRVEKIDDEKATLVCDTGFTEEDSVQVPVDDILGTVLTL